MVDHQCLPEVSPFYCARYVRDRPSDNCTPLSPNHISVANVSQLFDRNTVDRVVYDSPKLP